MSLGCKNKIIIDGGAKKICNTKIMKKQLLKGLEIEEGKEGKREEGQRERERARENNWKKYFKKT